MTTKIDRELSIIHSQLKEATRAYYLWKELLGNNKYNSCYDRNQCFWGSVIYSLEGRWTSLLSKILESNSYTKSGKVISLLGILERDPALEQGMVKVFILKHKSFFNNLTSLRNNWFSHTNKGYAFDVKLLTKTYPLDFIEIEKVLNTLPQILSALNPGHSYPVAYDKIYCSSSIKHLLSKL